MTEQTGPALWRIVKIGDVCLETSQYDPRDWGAASFYYVDISSVNNEEKRIVKPTKVEQENAPSRARQAIRAGDVLVSTVRPNLNAVAIVPEDLDGQICSTGFCVLRANRDLVEPEFLFAWVRSPEFVQQIMQFARGVGYPAVRDGDVMSVWIPLPPMLEQRRIVSLLQRAGELWQQKNTVRQQTLEISDALFFRRFGTGLPQGKDDVVIKLEELVEMPISSGYSPRTLDAPPGIPVYSLSALTEYGLDTSQLKYYPVDEYEGKGSELEIGDVLITRSNTLELVGRVGRYEGQPPMVIFPDTMIRIRLRDKRDSIFLEYYLRSLYMRSVIRRLARGTSGSMKKISQRDINSFAILWPPQDQRWAFAEEIRALEIVKETVERSATALTALLHSILARAFSGELTQSWRATHIEELEAAAAERDARLGSVHRVTPESPAERRTLLRARRTGLLDALTDGQRLLLTRIEQEFQSGRYVSAESLAQEERTGTERKSLRDVLESLTLFEQAALIQRVRVTYTPAEQSYYVPAQRYLSEEQDEAFDLPTFTSDEALV